MSRHRPVLRTWLRYSKEVADERWKNDRSTCRDFRGRCRCRDDFQQERGDSQPDQEAPPPIRELPRSAAVIQPIRWYVLIRSFPRFGAEWEMPGKVRHAGHFCWRRLP